VWFIQQNYKFVEQFNPLSEVMLEVCRVYTDTSA